MAIIKFSDLIKLSFHQTFGQDNEEWARNPFPTEGESLSPVEDHFDSHLGRFAAFISIPNWLVQKRIFGERDYLKQSWGNLAKKFVGWRDNGSIALNLFLAIFFLPINLFTTLVRTPINLIRLVTEFLPKLASNLIRGKILIDKTDRKGIFAENTRGFRVIGALVGSLALFLLELVRQISFSLTNPIKSAQIVWITLYRNPNSKFPWYIRAILGTVGVVGVVAIAIIGYTLLAGIPAIQAGATALLQLISGALPPVMTSVAAALQPILAWVGKAVAAYTLKVFLNASAVGQYLAATVAAVPELLGLTTLATLIITPIGAALSSVIDRFKFKWYVVPRYEANPPSIDADIPETRKPRGSYCCSLGIILGRRKGSRSDTTLFAEDRVYPIYNDEYDARNRLVAIIDDEHEEHIHFDGTTQYSPPTSGM